MPQPQLPTQRKTFTLQQANATLPLVRAIVSDLVELSHEVFERRQRLAMVFEGRRRDAFGPYRDGWPKSKTRRDTERLREYAEELSNRRRAESSTEKLVDFQPSWTTGWGHLCWKLGEPEITSGTAGCQFQVTRLFIQWFPGSLPSTS